MTNLFRITAKMKMVRAPNNSETFSLIFVRITDKSVQNRMKKKERTSLARGEVRAVYRHARLYSDDVDSSLIG